MDTLRTIFALQKLLDAYNDIDRISGELIAMCSETDKLNELSEKLEMIAEKQDSALSLPMLNDDAITGTDHGKLRSELEARYAVFSTAYKNAAFSYQSDKRRLTERYDESVRSRKEALMKRLLTLEDILSKQKLIDKEYFEAIPQIIKALNEGEAKSIEEAIKTVDKPCLFL